MVILVLFAVFYLLCFYFKNYGQGVKRFLARFKALISIKFGRAVVLVLIVSIVFSRPAQGLLASTAVGDLVAITAAKLLGSITGTVADIFEGVYNAVMNVFGDLVCILVEMFGDLIIDLLSHIPETIADSASSVAGYLQVANAWIPVAEIGVMFSAFIVYLTIQIPIKLFVKLFVPTVG